MYNGVTLYRVAHLLLLTIYANFCHASIVYNLIYGGQSSNRFDLNAVINYFL